MYCIVVRPLLQASVGLQSHTDFFVAAPGEWRGMMLPAFVGVNSRGQSIQNPLISTTLYRSLPVSKFRAESENVTEAVLACTCHFYISRHSRILLDWECRVTIWNSSKPSFLLQSAVTFTWAENVGTLEWDCRCHSALLGEHLAHPKCPPRIANWDNAVSTISQRHSLIPKETAAKPHQHQASCS